MARDAALLNLRDMIAIITHLDYQTRFVRFHAPDVLVNWGGIFHLRGTQRAQAIVDAIEHYRGSSPEMQEQCETLFRNLRTVALINADGDNTATMKSTISSHPKFSEWMALNADEPNDPANLAVFVNLAANGQLKAMTDAAITDAKEIWKEIVNKASSELNYQKFSPAVQFERSNATETERRQGISDFEKELRHHLTKSFAQRKPFVAVHAVQTQEHTRYLVTTSPLPRNVAVVKSDHTDTAIGKDTHAKSFEIIIDEAHCRAHASKTSLIGTTTVIEMFLRNVLKTSPCRPKKLSYEKSLQVFRNLNAIDSLPLPKEAMDGGARWIESLDVRLREDLLPVRFHGDEANDIYGQILQQIKESRFPRDKWIVVGAQIKLILPKTNPRNGKIGKLSEGGETQTYTLTLREKSFFIRGKDKTFDRNHLQVLDALPQVWGMEGLNISQKAIGKGAPSILQGRLNV